jgi:outer membrane protein OmpA-like peptidoglycan-associated protein
MRRLGLLLLLLCATAVASRADEPPVQRFVVFFQQWSAAFDDSSQAVVAQAADWMKSHPGNVAHVNGFADPTGSRDANILLSELRAQVVVDQLQGDGVDAARIQQRGHGSVEFALTSQEARRVEISIRQQ